MNIVEAKQQVKDTIEAYGATDSHGNLLLDPARQRPIFLIGAPGIGKTAIVSQIAEELGIGLVSYSMTHHTRQSALGLPFIVHQTYGDFEYEASEYTMSEIIASIYDFMRTSGLERGILFLDEINCVSETLYPSMLQFLQFKTFGRHKVPEGWIVVTAGNPPEYNRSAHEFDIVTLDRVKKIGVEPDYAAWKTYAHDKGVHPAVTSFLDIKKNRFYSIETTLEGKSFVTARGWDDLSDIIGLFERLGKTVDYDLIIQYVQSETIAREFEAYYDLFNKYRDDYQIETILAGDASEVIAERARQATFDERLSLLALILDALSVYLAEQLHRTEVTVAVRDDLREIKKAVFEDGADPSSLIARMIEGKSASLEVARSIGTIAKTRVAVVEDEIDVLRTMAEVLEGPAGEVSPAQGFSLVAQRFQEQAAELEQRCSEIEAYIANAYDFIDEVFGDGQEALVFTTELTSRPICARYIAQYGSASYYEHNSGMILSERQRDLQRRVEQLNL